MNVGRESRCPCGCASILGVRALWSILDPRNTRTTILATSRRANGRGRRRIQEARRPYRAPDAHRAEHRIAWLDGMARRPRRAPDAHRVIRRRAPAGLVPALERPDGPRRRRATAATKEMPDMLASRRTSPAVESMPEIPCEQHAVEYDGRLSAPGQPERWVRRTGPSGSSARTPSGCQSWAQGVPGAQGKTAAGR